ncbi:MAG: 50S ribosomal protein L29 [Candidatus Bathyarchaeia archaeon]
MPTLRMSEIRSMKPEERVKKLEELRTELFRLRTASAMGNVENPARIREMRRAIARLLTVEREGGS